MEEMNQKETMTLKDLETTIKTMIPDLSLAAEKPAHSNPFAAKMNMSTLDKIQVCVPQ